MGGIRIKTLVVGMVSEPALVCQSRDRRAAVIGPGDGAGQIANMTRYPWV